MTYDNKANTARIAKNTLFLYGRMLFGMIVSLYTSRVILNSLGVVDYGIIGVVGGLVGMLSIVSSALSSSISRFMTFELGRNDLVQLRKIFSTSVLIQVAMSVVVLIIGETVGLWFLNTQMTIPADRLIAANWIYQASIFSFILGLLGCPMSAAIIAHEKMDIFAYLGILDIFLKLAIVLFIAYSPFSFDRMICYSILLTIVGMSMQVINLIYCLRHFPEFHARLTFHKDIWKEMSGFAGWNSIGCIAAILRDQGVNVLLNVFFGPVVNASRGIAASVSGAINSFAGNFMTAVNPQITKSYASGDHKYLFSLVYRGSRFGYYILMTLAIPIIIETPLILTLWLKDYPEFTVIFVRLVLIASLVDILSNTLITLQVATGRIRNYQLAVGGLLLMNFPLSWAALHFGASPIYVYIVFIAIAIGCLFLRLVFLNKMVGLSISGYFRDVVLNVLTVSAISLIVPISIYVILPEGYLRFALVIAFGLISSLLAVLFIGCTQDERGFILLKAGGFKNRILRNVA